MALRHPDSSLQPLHREAGNVFFALFGTIVLLAALGATVSSFIKGPLTSSVQITRANAAETQMAVITQVITMDASSGGQCDADAEVEPIAWRDPAGSEPIPINGGLVPLTLGVASTKDPWGSEFGYCVWNHGASGTCPAGGRLDGATVNSGTNTVIAVISAGPDKIFTTTCRTFADADVTADGDLNDPTDFPLVAKTNPTDDDIIYTYSYEEATTASGGLWTLKSGDDTVATIDKDLQVGGSGIFSSGGTFESLNTDSVSARTGDFINMLQGFRIPDAAGFNVTCDDTINGVLRRSASGLEVCVDDNWIAATGSGASGGGSGPGNLEEGTDADCDNDGTGNIRFNSDVLAVEYCNGSSWQSLLSSTSAAALTIVPSSALTMTVEGPCVTTNCPNAYADPVHFIVTNLAENATAALSVSVTSPDGGLFTIDSTQAGSCQGATLAAGGTCIIRLLPLANGNGIFHGTLSILDGATPRLIAPLRIEATGFTCAAGVAGWGGIVMSCLNGTTPDYIINPAGCSTSPIEPDCSGVPADDPEFTNLASSRYAPDTANRNSGAQNIANIRGYGALSFAQNYCDTLVKGGYDDWYLPSIWELEIFIRPNLETMRIDETEQYWSSTYSGEGYGGSRAWRYDFANDWTESEADGSEPVRCVRRHGQPAATAEIDMSPMIEIPHLDFYQKRTHILPPKYTVSASQQTSSNDIIVTSINVPTPISISGPGSPTIRINGATPAASGMVRNTDIIQLVGTGPAAPGTENGFILTIGDRSFLWRVAYPAANTHRIFVTSTTYNGNLGGIAGGDTNCQARAVAAGLTGNWYALLGDRWVHAQNRVPWTSNRIENMIGEVVATSIEDLFDWSTEGVLFYTEAGARLNTANPWVGLATENLRGYQVQGTSLTCQNWTSSAAGSRGATGMPTATTEGLFNHSEFNCNNTRNLYCMGPF